MALKIPGFQEKTLDKVERLLRLLEELGRHPVLKGKLCMHGGTAINLFMLEAPRLSVDIDLSFIGAEGQEQMLQERPSIEKAVNEVITFSGYTSSHGGNEHAGRTFRLRYSGQWGPDQIKIDLIYLNRVPLIEPQVRECCLRSTLSVLTFSDFELAGGKVKALYDRVAIRDLYDISNIQDYLKEYLKKHPEQEDLCHKTMLFHASISKHFPLPLPGRVADRFSEREDEFETQLYPMLKEGKRPALKALVASAESFVDDYVLLKNEREMEYLERLAQADYQPAVLFEDYPTILVAAQKNPEALWKLMNLKKMLETS